MIPTWILDLDNTLYPAGLGLFPLIDERIDAFMGQRLGLDPEAIPELRETYRHRFGVTLGGLIAEHRVDPEEYLAFVHDVPLEPFLQPNPALVDTLENLPGRKVIFTNGSTGHAHAVLGHLGINGQIEGIYDIGFMDYVPKPFVHGYRKLLLELDVDPQTCWMVDDLAANLDTGRELGMTTVLVGPRAHPPHLHVERPAELDRVLGVREAGGPRISPGTVAAKPTRCAE